MEAVRVSLVIVIFACTGCGGETTGSGGIGDGFRDSGVTDEDASVTASADATDDATGADESAPETSPGDVGGEQADVMGELDVMGEQDDALLERASPDGRAADASCDSPICAPHSCFDGIKNGGETDIDCGGNPCDGTGCKSSCSGELHCCSDDECPGHYCMNFKCATNPCPTCPRD